MSSPNTSHSHEPGTPVHRITEAQESHTVEKRSRVVKYTISMSIRMACFIAAFFVHGWLQWVLLGAAVVLPYIAVVVANGGADLTKREPPAEFFAGDDPRLLTAGPQPTTAKPQAASSATSTPTEERNDDEYLGEDGELITDPPLSSRSDSPDLAQNKDSYPAEAPTTIDGSFVDEPDTPNRATAPEGTP